MRTAKVYQDGRLAWYRESATPGYWAQHWQQVLDEWDPYPDAIRGDLGAFDEPFTKYLPKTGPVLEAGCGLGQLVVALRERGWQAEGVDFAKATVDFVKSKFPHLPVRHADVTRLDVSDGYYSGYISLGVVEHRQEGPEPFLAEAWRVLRPGGIALISVPHVNQIRQLKARCGGYREKSDGLEFYQFAFREPEINAHLSREGFTVVDRFHYAALKTLTDELPGFQRLLKLPCVGRRLRRLIANSRLLDRMAGHMTLAVCRKCTGRPVGCGRLRG